MHTFLLAIRGLLEYVTSNHVALFPPQPCTTSIGPISNPDVLRRKASDLKFWPLSPRAPWMLLMEKSLACVVAPEAPLMLMLIVST